jgi:uncharacterized coiled-coil DUF342 family protein
VEETHDRVVETREWVAEMHDRLVEMQERLEETHEELTRTIIVCVGIAMI